MSEHSENRSRSDSSEVAFRKIFIGGLSYSTDEDKLKKYFKNYGAVQDAVVMKDPVSKRSRGFGFITYYDVSSVDNALANEPHTIDSRKVEAKRAVPRSEIARDMGGIPLKSSSTSPHSSYQSTPSASPQVTSHKSTASTSSNNSNHSSGGSQTAGHNGSHSLFDSRHALDPKINMEEYAYNKIFVGGLHYDTRDAEFRSYFEKYGKVISAEVMFNRETHKSRGFGFIVFETEQGAVKVCSEKEHSIDGKVVEVKRAIPRSKLASGGGGLAGVSMTVSGATATSKALANSSGGQGSVNLRQDVRRTMSQGSEDSYTSQQQKVNSMLSPMIANNTLSNAIRKPYNAASGVNPAVRSASGSTSYAAALKLGGAAAEDDAALSEQQSQPPQSLKSASGDGQVGNSLNNTLTSVSSNNSVHSGSQHSTSIGGNIDLQSLLYSSSQIAGMDTRPFRSYSEPIVKFEGGSSGLVGDLLSPFDLNAYRGTAVSRNSNNSSRSSSILLGPDTAVNSRRQSFDLLNSSSSQQHFSLGQASNHPSSNSLANIPWLSSPANVSLDGSMGGTLDPNGLLLPGSSLSHSGPISLQLPTAVGTIGSGSARTPRSSFTASSLDLHNGGAVTPGNTIENLFGLPSSSPPRQLGSAALNSNNNSDSDFQSSMTTFQALQQQASQAHQPQQQYSPQHQYQQAPPHQYQHAPFHQQQQHQQQYANGGNGYSHGLMDSALNLQQQQFPSHPQGAGPSADTWASMVMNHQRQDPRQDPQFPFYDQQQQQQALYQQQQHHPHQQHPMFQQSPSRQQPPHDSFYPPAQHQNHPHHYQQQQQQPGPFPPLQMQQQLFANEGARQQGFNGFAGEFATAAAPPRRDQPKAASQSVFGGLHGGSSQQMEASLDGLGSGLGSEADDLFQFKDLHMGSAEFDPKAPWLYASRT